MIFWTGIALMLITLALTLTRWTPRLYMATGISGCALLGFAYLRFGHWLWASWYAAAIIAIATVGFLDTRRQKRQAADV